MGIVAIVLAGFALRQMQAVLVPLILAWMISQLLAPMVKFFAKGRIPAGLAAVLALAILLFVFYWVILYVAVGAIAFANTLQQEHVPRVTAMATDGIRNLSEQFDLFSDDQIQGDIRKQVTGAATETARTLVGIAGKWTGAVLGLLLRLIMIFIMAAFMLLAQPYTENKIRNAFEPEIARRVSKILGSISRQLSHYLAVQFFLSLTTGLLVWLICRIVGVDAAATWGGLAFILNFIPTIGSIIAAVPPVLLALLQFESVWPAVWTLVGILAVNQVIGNIVTPKIMGDQMNLSPMTILLALLFWGWLWGIAGAFLSVIIVASIKIVCENIEPLRPISVLMESGKRMPAHPAP